MHIGAYATDEEKRKRVKTEVFVPYVPKNVDEGKCATKIVGPAGPRLTANWSN